MSNSPFFPGFPTYRFLPVSPLEPVCPGVPCGSFVSCFHCCPSHPGAPGGSGSPSLLVTPSQSLRGTYNTLMFCYMLIDLFLICCDSLEQVQVS